MILPPAGSNTEERATIYMMLAIMFLFFGCFLLIPGYFVGLGMIIPSLCSIAAGAILLSARYFVLRRYARSVVELRKEAAVRIRCRYCGSLNPDAAEKCESCGATL
jgi:ribosomal protein L40E